MPSRKSPSTPLSRKDFLTTSGASIGLLAAGCQPQKAPSKVDSRDIEALLGFEYTDEEWSQLLSGYEDQLDQLRIVRQLNFPNALPPAQKFDPRLPGIDYGVESSLVKLAARPGPLPEHDEDIAFAPATHLAHWIQTRKLSSLDLTEIYLDRIHRYNTTLECFITVTPEVARAQAKEADAEIEAGNYRGSLHGLPFGLKDLFDTKDVATTWGAAPYQQNVPQSDAHIVDKLRDAGAVLLGKTSCGALAYGDIWYDGVTRNPWEIREGSSGSSAGSASATAAGLVAFSIGTETLGSIISPSVRCGVTGLRPTFGRIGRTGGMALCWSLDKIGPICRTVEDTALVLSVLNGFDPDDPSSISSDFGYDGTRSLSGFTVGYDPQFVSHDGKNALDPEILEKVRSLGVKLKEVVLPQSDYRPLILQLQAEAAAAFAELTLSDRDDELRWQVDQAWPNSWRKARLIPAVDYIQVDRLRRVFMHEMHKLFQEVDVVIGGNFDGGMLQISNYTGHPQLTLPSGFKDRPIRPAFEENSVSEGETAILPGGIGLWSGLFDESKLLAVGRGLEEILSPNSVRPNL